MLNFVVSMPKMEMTVIREIIDKIIIIMKFKKFFHFLILIPSSINWSMLPSNTLKGLEFSTLFLKSFTS